MELILRNESMVKIKPLSNAVFKCSYGVSGTPNDFTVELPFEKDVDAKVYNYINFGNTEFGGKILGKAIDTSSRTVSLYGPTLRGAMQNAVAVRYTDLTLSGTDVEIVTALFSNTTLKYTVDETYNSVERTVVIPLGSNLLFSVETALKVFDEGFVLYISDNEVHLKIVPLVTLDARVDAYTTDMVLDDNLTIPNAFYGMGNVEGTGYIAALYADRNGNISKLPTLRGDAAVELFREYKNDFKSYEELEANALKDFLSARNKGTKTDINVDLTNGNIGDRVNVSAMELNTTLQQTVTERHLEYTENNIDLTYSTGG